METERERKPSFVRKHADKLDLNLSKWFKGEDRLEEIFMKNNPHLAKIDEHNSNYYLCNWDFVFKLYKAGNELHQACLKATERVLSDDSLLAKFGNTHHIASCTNNLFLLYIYIYITCRHRLSRVLMG